MTTGNHDRPAEPGIDRRRLLKCMAWAGSGVIWTLAGGVPAASILPTTAVAATRSERVKGFSFVQISDTHIGFAKDANPDVVGTLAQTIQDVNVAAPDAAFVLHTGDVTHLSKPEEFDTAAQLLKGLRQSDLHVVPGEHDVLDADKSLFFQHYGRGSVGQRWYAFDHAGVHIIALINVLDLQPGGQGRLGPEQLKWLADDLKGRSASQPIVVFAHMPLFELYPQWGWGTDDAEQAMSYLRRFGSVTVLNGHVHQIAQKVEGNLRFFTARSTAYPQPAPGSAASPGPLKVEPDRLKSVLGLRSISVSPGNSALAITDSTLADG
jgi:3',5'-cyclic AMP phosphodiesterase CpdA